MWKNFISYTKTEDKFWKINFIVDDISAEVESIIMTIGDTLSDDFSDIAFD